MVKTKMSIGVVNLFERLCCHFFNRIMFTVYLVFVAIFVSVVYRDLFFANFCVLCSFFLFFVPEAAILFPLVSPSRATIHKHAHKSDWVSKIRCILRMLETLE